MADETNPFAAVGQASAPPPPAPTGGAMGMPQVPGAPAPMGGPGTAPAQQKDALMQLLKQMTARAQAHTSLPQGNPQSVSQPGKMASPPYGGVAAQKQAFLHNIGAVVSGAVAEKKKADIQKAANDWEALQQTWEEAQTMAGDPSAPDYQQKLQAKFKELVTAKHLLDDPKKLKNMAKSLQQDWLNPEKAENTLYKQGLNKHLSMEERRAAMDQMKEKMAERIAQHQKPTPKDTTKQTEWMISEQRHQDEMKQRDQQHQQTMARYQAQLAETMRQHKATMEEKQREFNEKLKHGTVTDEERIRHNKGMEELKKDQQDLILLMGVLK